MAVTWTFDDGVQNHACTSFPYAFRMMFNTLKKGVESGKSYADMVRVIKIVSPIGRIYNHQRATDLATQQGLLTPEGIINSREFKKR